MIEVSKVEYKKGMHLRDDKTNEVFKVRQCTKHGNEYRLDLELVKNYEALKLLDKLNDAINNTNLHDKDIFMIENIILEVKGALQ